MVCGGGTFGRWFGHESGALTNEISAFIKETRESSLLPSASWGHRIYEPGSKSSPDSESAGASTLVFPDSRTLRNRFLLLFNHPVYGDLLQQPEWARIPSDSFCFLIVCGRWCWSVLPCFGRVAYVSRNIWFFTIPYTNLSECRKKIGCILLTDLYISKRRKRTGEEYFIGTPQIQSISRWCWLCVQYAERLWMFLTTSVATAVVEATRLPNSQPSGVYSKHLHHILIL